MWRNCGFAACHGLSRVAIHGLVTYKDAACVAYAELASYHVGVKRSCRFPLKPKLHDAWQLRC